MPQDQILLHPLGDFHQYQLLFSNGFLEGGPELLHPCFNLIFLGIGVVQTEGPGLSLASKEWIPGYEGHVVLQAFLEEGHGIIYSWYLNPEEHPTFRIGVLDPGWEVLLDPINHQLLTLTVEVADLLDVGVNVIVGKELSDRILDQVISVQVSRLLQDSQLVDHGLIGNDPAQPETRRQGLGEGTQIGRAHV